MTDSQPADQTPQYGYGPFTLREVILLGVWLVAFIVSFFPLGGVGAPSIWTSGIAWILAIGVPTAAVGLIVLRRFSPDGIRRVGSLGIDQFASVAFSVAAIVWLQIVWAGVAVAIAVGGFPGSWVAWLELILMLGGVALTVFAPLIPMLGDDFVGRPEIPAHRFARPVLPVEPRPAGERAPRPAREPKPPREPKSERQSTPSREPEQQQGFDPQELFGQQGDDSRTSGGVGSDSGTPVTDSQETAAYAPVQGSQPASEQPVSSEQAPAGQQSAGAQNGGQQDARQQDAGRQDASQQDVGASSAPAQQAFWALAPAEREVVDQYGTPLFRIGPTAWALVIEDRGNVFVVRDEDGRTGFLTDVSGVMRG